MMKRFYLLWICLTVCVTGMGRGISGNVVDARHEAVEGASIVLQTIDSVFVEACITGADGSFSFRKEWGDYRLIVQHLSYKTLLVPVTGNVRPLSILLEENSEQMKEVVVKVERPMVKVKDNGALVYDASLLSVNRPVTNALDLLEEVPGVMKNGEELLLVGSGKTTVLINGRKRSMSADDIRNLLASTSPSRVKSVDVYYNTPPQYGVKGSSINVVMVEQRSEKTSMNGSVHTSAYHGRRYYQTGGGEWAVFKKNGSLDIGYSLGSIHKKLKEDITSHHWIGNELTDLTANTDRDNQGTAHQLKTYFSYDLKNNDKLSLLYVVRFDKAHIRMNSPLVMEDVVSLESKGDIRKSSCAQTMNMDYLHKTLNLGLDFVLFDSDIPRNLTNNGSNRSWLASTSSQKAHKGNFYLHHSCIWGTGTLSYGLDAALSATDNIYRNQWTGDAIYADEDNRSTQDECTVDAFAGWQQKVGKKATLSVNLQAFYAYANMLSDGKKSTLWNGLYFLPNLSCTYRQSSDRIWMLTFSSDRIYPKYSVTTNSKNYHNNYLVEVGNPSLKPYVKYESHLKYILKSKYVLGLFAEFNPGMYFQSLYQDPAELQASYRWVNFDYYNNVGVTAVVPHRWNNFVDSRLTANLLYNCQKGMIMDLPFDRQLLRGVFSLSNTCQLNREKTFSFQLGFTVQTPVYQGYYTRKTVANLSAALAWSPKNSGWNLTLKGNDLLNSSPHKIKVDYRSQHYYFVYNNDVRQLNLTARYTFKEYKQKKERVIDTSRMGI